MKNDKKQVSVHFIPFYKGKVYLEEIDFTGEPTRRIDSADISYETDSLHFEIDNNEEKVYRIRIKEKPNRIHFISDQPQIHITVDNPDWSAYHFQNNGFNNLLRTFLVQQRKITDSITKLRLKKSPEVDSLVTRLADSMRIRDINFADTVSSPGAFLFVYNRIDFGPDFNGIRNLVSKAAQRFPSHVQLQLLKKEVLNYISIFETEYETGQSLPGFTLPDDKDQAVSLSSTRGHYVFIDLWSTWCVNCFQYIEPKKKLASTFPSELQVVSIAVDAKKEVWREMVREYQIPGIHLIDVKMWKGPAVMAMKFDSIPFNFLLDPNGKILAKAIKPDSVLPLVSKFIQR